MKPIVAVIVLYRMSIASSPACRTLSALLRSSPIAQQIDLLVFDNSPEPQPVPPDYPGRYMRDGSNPGLARRYNQALAEAEMSGASWLLLLDQDTSVTVAYLNEFVELAARLARETNVVAIVPKLIENGRLQSPHTPLYRGMQSSFDPEFHGLASTLIRAYNSGALIRVQAIRAIGGFPESYWLDYLDHAVFHQLQAKAASIYVAQARLEHEMSIHRPDRYRDTGNSQRHYNQLAAQLQFYREFGSAAERLRNRLDLIRQGCASLLRGHAGEGGRLLAAAIGGIRQRRSGLPPPPS